MLLFFQSSRYLRIELNQLELYGRVSQYTVFPNVLPRFLIYRKSFHHAPPFNRLQGPGLSGTWSVWPCKSCCRDATLLKSLVVLSTGLPHDRESCMGLHDIFTRHTCTTRSAEFAVTSQHIPTQCDQGIRERSGQYKPRNHRHWDIGCIAHNKQTHVLDTKMVT